MYCFEMCRIEEQKSNIVQTCKENTHREIAQKNLLKKARKKRTPLMTKK